MTLQEMAEKVNSSAGYISEIERGKKIPGSKLIFSLKRNFKSLDLNKLFRITHEKDPVLLNLTVDSSANEKEEEAALEIIDQIEQGPWTDRKKIKLIDSVCTIVEMDPPSGH